MHKKKSFSATVMGLGLTFLVGAAPAPSEAVLKVAQSLVWTGQSSVIFTVGDLRVAVDPLDIPAGTPKVDLILVTHTHDDHLSRSNLLALADPARTVVAGPDLVVERAKVWFRGKTEVLSSGTTATVAGVSVQSVPAYNIQRKGLHDKNLGFLGYIVDVGGVKVYLAGDTERIPEMQGLACDIVLLPLGQTYTMANVQEAVDAALDTGASLAIPYHYGKYEGRESDADLFLSLLEKAGMRAQKMTKVTK